MKTKLNETVSGTAPNGFAVFTGTSGNKAAIAIRKLEYVYGKRDPEDRLRMVALDAQGVESTFPAPMLQVDMDGMTLGANEFVPVVMPDPESLEKAEQSGKLWAMDLDWYKKPGVSKDNLGSGGNPRNGRGMIHLNVNRIRKKIRRSLRDCGDYRRQRQLLEKSESKKAVDGTITVVVCLSLLGGFGTGTSITLLRTIREEALALKLPTKIVVLGMVLGSIEPADKDIAARNQAVFLRELNAILSGQFGFMDQWPQGQPLCDSVILISNANNQGEFDNLDRLISLAAQYIFYLFHTTLGRSIQEKAVDIEEYWAKDDLGGCKWTSTMSLSKIHLDLPRTNHCIAHKLVYMFLGHLLTNEQQQQAIKEAGMVASEQALRETATSSLACERLYRLTAYGNADARQRGSTAFNCQAGNRWGYRHCCDLENASEYALHVEVGQRLVPQMHREAEKFNSTVKKAIANKSVMMLAAPDGIARSIQFLEALAERVAGFVKANHKKLEVAQAKKKQSDEILGRGADLLNGLKGRFWPFRALSFSTKREITRIYSVYTESAIRNRLEIAARLLMANEIYPAVQESIGEQLAQVHQIVANITAGQKDVGCEANRLCMLEPTLTVPLGKELATEEFIDAKYDGVLAQEGGPKAFLQRIFEYFRGHYKNLIAFNYHDWDQIKETLLDYSAGTADRHLSTLNVVDVLGESCKSADELKERLAQCMRESNGRLRLTGEADEIIPTIKFLGVNDSSAGEKIAKMANEIDTTNGDWRIIETRDPNTIVFFQQRSRVSVVRVIADSDKFWTRPDSVVERAKLGSDPVLALIPAPNCPDQEVQVIIAMGFVSGALGLSERGYELDSQNGGRILLGTTPDEVVGSLRENYNRLVALYESFVRGLVRDYAEIGQRLDYYVRNSGADEGLPTMQLGRDPFVRVLETVAALMPYLRRMPLNCEKEEARDRLSSISGG